MSTMTKRTHGFTKDQGEDSSFRLSDMKGGDLIQTILVFTVAISCFPVLTDLVVSVGGAVNNGGTWKKIFFVPTCGSLGFTISDFGPCHHHHHLPCQECGRLSPTLPGQIRRRFWYQQVHNTIHHHGTNAGARVYPGSTPVSTPPFVLYFFSSSPATFPSSCLDHPLLFCLLIASYYNNRWP